MRVYTSLILIGSLINNKIINPVFFSAAITVRSEMLNILEAKQAGPVLLRFLCAVAPNPPCSEELFVHTIVF